MPSHRSFHDHLQGLGFSRRTIGEYQRIAQSAEVWCESRGRTLARASGPFFAQYVETTENSWATRKALRSALKHYWQFHRRQNPPLGVIRVPPQPKPVCRAHEEDEAMRLAKVARAHTDRKGFALALGLYQAMRRIEIARTRWADFDSTHVTIIGKGDKKRRIDLHDELLDKLATAPREGEFVFAGRFGGHVSTATIWSWIRELGEEAGVPDITPHRLRHTCLATQNDNTGNIRAVQQFAGHSKLDTTQIYTRTTARAMRQVVRSVDYLGENTGGRRRPLAQPGLFDEVGEDEGW